MRAARGFHCEQIQFPRRSQILEKFLIKSNGYAHPAKVLLLSLISKCAGILSTSILFCKCLKSHIQYTSPATFSDQGLLSGS